VTAYPHIAAALFDRAHCIEPNALRAILEGPLAQRVLAGEPIGPAAKKGKAPKVSSSRLSAIVDCQPVKVAGGVAEFGLTDAGVAILPVCGVLSRRFDWLSALCGWSTYEGLSAAFDQMLADSRVLAILMDVETPGGEAAGMLDICDKIIANRNVKPIWAVANTYAASAGYGVAGSAERLFVPRLGRLGSIGAVIVHVDKSAADAAVGEKYTAIYAGARKIDGWGHAPLADGARASLQAVVDNCRNQFAELVGRQGRMTKAQAMKTEAGMASDFEAVEARYADAVGTFDEALTEITDLAAGRSRSPSAAAKAGQPGGPQAMKTQNDPAAAAAQIDKPDPASAPAASTTAPAAAASSTGPETPPAAAPAAAATPAPDAPAPAANAPAAPQQPAAAAPEAYSAEMATETMELCTLAGASLADARAFVAAKTPVDQVRAKLAAAAAARADEPSINPTPKPTSQTHGWDEVTAAVNKQNGFGPKK
jgi:ClpP class serine protease